MRATVAGNYTKAKRYNISIMKVTDNNHIIEAEHKLLTAMKEGNISLLNEMLHEDLLFVIPTGQTVTKEMDLANLQSGNLKIEDISSSDQEISLIGDNAIVSVIIKLKGSYLNQPVDGTFKYIRTWKLFDDGWKVIGGAGIQV